MEYIERVAKLMEAGDYPDKGVNITEADLDAIIEHYNKEAPIRIEHTDTPLDGAMGYLVEVWRQGKELWGKLKMSKPLYELLQATGKRGLSVGLDWANRVLREVSLTTSPRIQSATVFSAAIDLETKKEDDDMAKTKETEIQQEAEVRTDMSETQDSQDKKLILELSKQVEELQAEVNRLREENAAIEFALRQAKHQKHTDELVASGKLPPALRDDFVAILGRVDKVEFSAEEKSNCADALLALMSRMPGINFSAAATPTVDKPRHGNIERQLGLDAYTPEKIAEIRQKYGI